MDKKTSRWNLFPNWDPWPLTRLLLVFMTLYLWAHWRFALVLPTPPALARAAFGMFEIFCLCALIGLGQLYMLAVLFPLFGAIMLNDWFYDGCYWLLGLAGPRSPRWKAGFALAGECCVPANFGHSLTDTLAPPLRGFPTCAAQASCA